VTTSYHVPQQSFTDRGHSVLLTDQQAFSVAYREAQLQAVAAANTVRLSGRIGRYIPPAEDPLFLLVQERMVEGDRLRDQYMELPIAVQLEWPGYPVINAALAQLSYGWYMDASLLSDAVWTDDQVATCLNTRTNALFSRPIDFLAQGEGTSQTKAEDDGPVEAAKQAVKRAIKSLWNDMLPLAAIREIFRWGVLTNLGVGELVWSDHGMPSSVGDYLAEKMPGISVPTSLMLPTIKSWNTQFCYWRWDTRSNWLIHQAGQIELHPGNGRWVTYSPQGHNHGFLYGAIRQLGALWLDRKFTYRDWARAEEKLAIGIIKATEPADADPSDKATFEAIVRNLPPEATVILPQLDDDRKFDLEMMKNDQVGSGWELFVKRGDKLDVNIAKLLLGQNLSTEAGGSHAGGSAGAAGTRASNLQDSVRKDYMFADSQSVGDMMKHQILKPFVFHNFKWLADLVGCPWEDLVPEATYQVEPKQDKMVTAQAAAQIASALADFATAGAPIDARALMEQTELPVLDKDELPDIPHSGGSERPYAELVPGAGPDPSDGRTFGGWASEEPETEVEADGSNPGPTGLPQDYDHGPRPGKTIDEHDVDEDQLRATVTDMVKILRSRVVPNGARSGARQGQEYVDRLTAEARKKIATLLSNHRKQILKIATGSGTYDQRKNQIARTFKLTSTAELSLLMRHLILASKLAGRAASKLDAQDR
jgi:phage gp29-like protein